MSLNTRSQIEINPKDINKSEFPDSLLSTIKIETIELGQTDIELKGKITAIRPPSVFTKKDGSEGRVASIEVADETGKIKITLWDSSADLTEKFKVNDIVEISGGYSRQGLNDSVEIHLGKNGSIEKNTKIEIDVPTEILESSSTIITSSKSAPTNSKEVRLADLDESMKNISVIARITGISNIREFQRSDGTESKVGSLLVKDNSGPSRITLWNNMTDYIKKVDIGDVVRVEGAYVKLGLKGEPEVHVGRNTTIEINPEYLKDALPQLEINFKEISSLEPRERDVNVKALVMRVQEIRTFAKHDGSEGRVLNIGISDNSGSTRLVAWDEKAIELENLEEMTPIEILHGYTKEGNQGVEIHLGTLSTVRKSSEAGSLDISKIKSSQTSGSSTSAKRVDMIDLEEGDFSEIRGTILKIYEGKMYYNSCPECRKKVAETEDGNWKCNEHGTVEPQHTLFVSIALDDSTGCVRVTFFRELAENLLNTNATAIIDEIEQVGIQTLLINLEQKIKGREIIVRGKPRRNKFDDGMDLIASTFLDIDSKNEIELAKSSLKA